MEEKKLVVQFSEAWKDDEGRIHLKTPEGKVFIVEVIAEKQKLLDRTKDN